MQVVNVYNNKNFDIYIGRPPQGGHWRFGNPFVIGRDGTRDECIRMFEEWLKRGESFGCIEATNERRKWILDNLAEIKGKILGCFCKPQNCHGDVLIDLCTTQKTKNGGVQKAKNSKKNS